MGCRSEGTEEDEWVMMGYGKTYIRRTVGRLSTLIHSEWCKRCCSRLVWVLCRSSSNLFCSVQVLGGIYGVFFQRIFLIWYHHILNFRKKDTQTKVTGWEGGTYRRSREHGSQIRNDWVLELTLWTRSIQNERRKKV